MPIPSVLTTPADIIDLGAKLETMRARGNHSPEWIAALSRRVETAARAALPALRCRRAYLDAIIGMVEAL
jgi:hypothetical protein